MRWTAWRRSEIICEAEGRPGAVYLAGLEGVEVQSVPHNGEEGPQLGQLGLALPLGQCGGEGYRHSEQLAAVGVIDGRQNDHLPDYPMRDWAEGVRK